MGLNEEGRGQGELCVGVYTCFAEIYPTGHVRLHHLGHASLSGFQVPK